MCLICPQMMEDRLNVCPPSLRIAPGLRKGIGMGIRVESAEYLDRWDVLDTWSVEVLALPATSSADVDTMREAVRTGLLVMAQHLASHGVTVALSS
jgi:hypothetical protein